MKQKTECRIKVPLAYWLCPSGARWALVGRTTLVVSSAGLRRAMGLVGRKYPSVMLFEMLETVRE